MADNFSLFLLAAMDRLWFHQTILFLPEEPFSLYSPKTLKPKQPNSSESAIKIPSSSSSLSLSSSLAEDTSTAVCPLPDQPDDSKTEEQEMKKRPTRVSHCSSRSRSHSSSSPSSTQKRDKNHRHSTSCSLLGRNCKLKKSMGCRSLKDLELEEVKGFMDLGFIFKKEHLNARMISVVPGLLRLGFFKKTKQKLELNLAAADEHDEDDIEQEDERCVIRPYLSEAWLIKRPDSPLLNLRVPRVSAAADMKKHLKFWARTVASVIQQES